MKSQLTKTLKIMLKTDVIQHYGSQKTLGEVLNFKSSGTISLWGEVVPEKYALILERLTDGELSYDSSFYPDSPLFSNPSTQPQDNNPEVV